MARRPSTLLTSAQVRARDRRLAADANTRCVSVTAIGNLIERECDKVGRDWYRAGMVEGVPMFNAVSNEIDALRPDSLKEARQLVLARLDRFPEKKEQ